MECSELNYFPSSQSKYFSLIMMNSHQLCPHTGSLFVNKQKHSAEKKMENKKLKTKAEQMELVISANTFPYH